MRKSWPAWQKRWGRACEQRSALAFFVALTGRAGFHEVAASIDMQALDDESEREPWVVTDA